MNRLCIFVLLVTGLTACSFYPYQNKVACRLSDTSGKCISVQDAYDEAVTGIETYPHLKKGKQTKKKKAISSNVKSHPTSSESNQEPSARAENYITAKYNELAKLIKAPITPMLSPPKTVRTLIISYSKHNDRTILYMPRYVYSIVEDATFVMGDYLNQSQPPIPLGLIQERSE